MISFFFFTIRYPLFSSDEDGINSRNDLSKLRRTLLRGWSKNNLLFRFNFGIRVILLRSNILISVNTCIPG